MSDCLHIDFETRSVADLRKTGVHRYAEHDSTDIWILGFAFNDEPVESEVFRYDQLKEMLVPPESDRLDRIQWYVAREGRVVAHNAQFEVALWNTVLFKRFGWPELRIAQVDCTAARALAMSLPSSLAGAADALGLDVQKDDDGRRLMLQMCRPRKLHKTGPPIWWDDDDRVNRLAAYCRTDVEVERELDKRLMRLMGDVA